MYGVMIKATLSNSKIGMNSTDRGKQGVKHSLLAEAVVITLVLARANRHDMKLVNTAGKAMHPLPAVAPKRPCPLSGRSIDEIR